MQNIVNRLFRIIFSGVILLILLFSIIFIIFLIPSKSRYIDRPELPMMFKKLAEYKVYSSDFLVMNNNLNRIDVLFKNQALESKERLKVEIFDNNNRLIFSQNYDSNNFGDTNRVRMDFETVADSQGKMFKVVITPLEIVDWKMYFGVKDNDIDLIQYFDYRPTMLNSFNSSVNLMKNWVFVLPLITVILFLW